MKPAAIYARVSTSAQADQGTSLNTQHDLCAEYATANGYTIIEHVSEDASGATLERPGLERIRTMAATHMIEAAIVFDPDRLTRSLAHLYMLSEEFDKLGVELLFVNAPRDNTPEGQMLFGMRGLFAQYEREKIKDRMRRGKERRIKEGKVFMSPLMAPYGYTYVKGEGRLEVVPEEAAWVVQIYRWLLEDRLSLHAIAHRLTANSVPTKRGATRWDPSTVQSILTNATYTGVWHHNKTKSRADWIAVEVPALIPTEWHSAAQTQLSANLRHSPRNTRQFYLLRGLLVCGGCGTRMKCRNNSRYNTRHYVCRNAGPGGCDAPYVTAHLLEDVVWRGLVNHYAVKTSLPEAVAGHHSNHARTGVEAELSALTRRSQALTKERTKLLDLYTTTEAISKEEFAQRMATIRDREATLAGIRTELEAERDAVKEQAFAGEQYEVAMARLRDGLALNADMPRRLFLETVRLAVTVHRDSLTVSLEGGLLTPFSLPVPTRGGRKRNKGRA